MKDLLAGYRQFRENQFPALSDRYERLARKGQAPKALVIACSDSRVDPQMIFAAVPGDLFVVRNVANLVPPYKPNADYHGTSAALEFAVTGLEVPQIIVMGHARCGGIAALLAGGDQGGDFIGRWMEIAAEAREKVCGCPAEEAQARGEQEGVRVSLRNLATFPWIRDRMAAGRLALHGSYFDVATGELWLLDPETDSFVLADEAPEAGFPVTAPLDKP